MNISGVKTYLQFSSRSDPQRTRPLSSRRSNFCFLGRNTNMVMKCRVKDYHQNTLALWVSYLKGEWEQHMSPWGSETMHSGLHSPSPAATTYRGKNSHKLKLEMFIMNTWSVQVSGCITLNNYRKMFVCLAPTPCRKPSWTAEHQAGPSRCSASASHTSDCTPPPGSELHTDII